MSQRADWIDLDIAAAFDYGSMLGLAVLALRLVWRSRHSMPGLIDCLCWLKDRISVNIKQIACCQWLLQFLFMVAALLGLGLRLQSLGLQITVFPLIWTQSIRI